MMQKTDTSTFEGPPAKKFKECDGDDRIMPYDEWVGECLKML